MPTLKEIVARLAAAKKLAPSDMRSNPTIPRRHSFPVRNLIYHVYPGKGNDLWRANVRQLVRRWDLFTGRRLIAVAIGPKSHGLDEVTREFGDVDADFRPFANDPELREVLTFRPLLEQVADTDPGTVTFYAHSKGNATLESAQGPQNAADRVRGATRWRNAMYHHLLDRWLVVEQALTRSAAVGTTQMEGRFRYPSGLTFGPGFWMFAGTFFWLRHDVIFGLPNWREIAADRYGAEAWLGSLLPMSAVASVFQPWPPAQWPQGSPYNPTIYAENFDDDETRPEAPTVPPDSRGADAGGSHPRGKPDAKHRKRALGHAGPVRAAGSHGA
jgi:hypothetical protein